MKKRLLYLLLLISGFASAQIVNIPDTNFKNKLLSATVTNNVAKDVNGNSIVIDSNADSEIQESEALLVHELRINNAAIYDLTGIQAFTNLESLNCDYNNLVALDVTSLSSLKLLECKANALATLNVSGMINLESLNCAGNNIMNIDVSSLINLITLDCSANDFTTIDVSSNINLESFTCNDANLTTLNLNNNINLTYLSCYGNDIVTLYIKNGQDEDVDFAVWGENPTLEYVCADDFQVEDLLAVQVNPAVIVDSFCLPNPTGEHNTITGTAIFDSESNGCDSGDLSFPFVKMRISNGTNYGFTFTNSLGEYRFYTLNGDFTITPQFENDWFTVTSALVSFPVVDDSVSVQDFCIEPNGVHNDVEVVIAPVITARPGFEAVYKIVYKNNGNQAVSGTILFERDYAKLALVESTPVPDDIVTETYQWNFENLQPFENREIVMTFHVNSPTDNPAVNIDDVLHFTTSIEAGADENSEDNEFVFDQVVIGSFDPNNIICIEGESVPSDTIGDYLHYVVNFENIGTEAADFVVVTNVINENDYDLNSLQILNSSHQAWIQVEGNRVEFLFDDINLNALEHGNILFKLKSKNDLTEGDDVMNKVSIVFDYNSPISTNEATTVFEALTSGIGKFETDNSVKVYPNPVQNNITVEAAGNVESVSLYDIQGRILQTLFINEKQVMLDMSSRQDGVYFIKVTTDEGVKVEKIIKK